MDVSACERFEDFFFGDVRSSFSRAGSFGVAGSRAVHPDQEVKARAPSLRADIWDIWMAAGSDSSTVAQYLPLSTS